MFCLRVTWDNEPNFYYVYPKHTQTFTDLLRLEPEIHIQNNILTNMCIKGVNGLAAEPKETEESLGEWLRLSFPEARVNLTD